MAPDFEQSWKKRFELYSRKRKSDRFSADYSTDYSFKRRFEKLMRGLRFNKNQLVLDLGCGPGLMASKMLPAKVVCIDYSFGMLLRARKNLKKGLFVLGDARHLPFRENAFDYIICAEALQYISEPSSVVKGIAQCLKKGGVVRLSTLSRKHIMHKIKNILGKEVEYHHPNEIANCFRKNNLSITKIEDIAITSEKMDRILDSISFKGLISRVFFIEGVKL